MKYEYFESDRKRQMIEFAVKYQSSPPHKRPKWEGLKLTGGMVYRLLTALMYTKSMAWFIQMENMLVDVLAEEEDGLRKYLEPYFQNKERWGGPWTRKTRTLRQKASSRVESTNAKSKQAGRAGGEVLRLRSVYALMDGQSTFICEQNKSIEQQMGFSKKMADKVPTEGEKFMDRVEKTVDGWSQALVDQLEEHCIFKNVRRRLAELTLLVLRLQLLRALVKDSQPGAEELPCEGKDVSTGLPVEGRMLKCFKDKEYLTDVDFGGLWISSHNLWDLDDALAQIPSIHRVNGQDVTPELQKTNRACHPIDPPIKLGTRAVRKK